MWTDRTDQVIESISSCSNDMTDTQPDDDYEEEWEEEVVIGSMASAYSEQREWSGGGWACCLRKFCRKRKDDGFDRLVD